MWLNVGETYDVITSAGAVRGQVKVSAVPTNTTAASDVLRPRGGG